MILFSIILQATNTSNVTVFTIIGVIAAAISAFSAFKSRGYSRLSYELAMKNYNDRQANFSIYLVDSYRRKTQVDIPKKFLLFHVTVSNKSDSKNSFRADLIIEYIRSDSSVAKVIVPHNESYQKQISQTDFSTFPNDIRIDERGMLSKWLIFEQPESVFNNYRIEKYSIKLTDAQGNTNSIESSIIKELTND